MAVSRFYDPKPVFFDNSGIVCAGGTLYFFESDVITPKHAYAEPELSTDLGVSVDLDASGRLESPVFLSGAYCAQLKDADDVQVWFQEDLGETDAGAIVALDPADGTDGQVYSTDGVDALWRDVQEVPDCTGNSGKYLGTDGTDPAWTAFPAATVYDETTLPGGFTQTSTSFQAGKMKWQYGSGTVAASGALTASLAVTFAEAYTTLLHVNITLTGSGGSTPQGAKPTHSYVGSLTGFTIYLYAADEHDSPGWLLTGATSFTYEAVGIVA